MLSSAAQTDVPTRFRSQEKEHQTSVAVTDEMELSAERLAEVYTALERFQKRQQIEAMPPGRLRDEALKKLEDSITKWKKARVLSHLLKVTLPEEWAQFGGEPETEDDLQDLLAKVEKRGAESSKAK